MSELLLDRQMEQFSLALEVLGEAVTFVSNDGRIRYANTACESLYGYGRSELEDRSIDILVPPEGASNGGMLPDERWERDAIGVRKDGETFFSHLISTQVKADGEVATGRLVVHRDVTLRRRLEDQLLQARRMEAVGRLAGGIAHDFNNLLTPILSYAELAANSLPEGSARYGYLQEILKAAK